ncbi:tyrosine-type recombinase/integrase [Paraburkholderia sp. EG287A]|uniref:tyrosine-type recombinase/integrase n=1 Tax=unclassified Paraburkholderia TaxID=2615204 RepID=UPI0034D1E660
MLHAAQAGSAASTRAHLAGDRSIVCRTARPFNIKYPGVLPLDHDGSHIGSRAMVVQQKTQRPVQFEITEQTRLSIEAWMKVRSLKSADYLFPSRMRASPHISTRQYARMVHRWISSIGLDDAAYGTHTMRRTKASLIYRRTKNLRAVQLLLGHTKLESTVRYLGIEVDDALEMAAQTEV